MKKEPLAMLSQIAQTLFDKKGFNILAIDVRDVSTMTDFFVIAEGNVDKHVTALGHAVLDLLGKEGEKPVHVEGMVEGDWVVLDYLDVVIHIFSPAMRDKYRLEEVWHQGKIVDLAIDVSHNFMRQV